MCSVASSMSFASSSARDQGRVKPQRGILVLDLDPLVGEGLREGLPAYGFSVWATEARDEALGLLLRHRWEIDLVLMDSRLLDGAGEETLTALREAAPGIRVCFTTECLCRQSSQDLFGHGAVGILVKPFRLDGLASALRLLAGSRQLPPSVS